MLDKLRQWLICCGTLIFTGLVSATDGIYDIHITRVIDGDTIAFAAPGLPHPLKPELSLRIWGIDTPESGFRAKCDAERSAAVIAKGFTSRTIGLAKKTQIVLHDHDKYGGRVLGDLLLDGVSFRETILQHKHALPYNGGVKHDWCATE